MSENKAVMDEVCATECPSRWCCSIRHFPPPPVCLVEIDRIRQTGAVDFFEKDEGEFHLKIKPNGYCIFFDDHLKTCTIYLQRPFDCRIFPFDFCVRGSNAYWVLWDCPYSRKLGEGDIEAALARYEILYASQIRETWAYGLEDYEKKMVLPDPTGFMILRQLNRFPPATP